jgi:hypothetical protein
VIQNDVIAPRKATNLPEGHAPEKLQLALQSMYPHQRVSHVVRNIIPRLTRPNAGLIFTPVAIPYSMGINKALFQWRPTSLNSVDFQLNVEWKGSPPAPLFKLFLREGHTNLFHDWITFAPRR